MVEQKSSCPDREDDVCCGQKGSHQFNKKCKEQTNLRGRQ